VAVAGGTGGACRAGGRLDIHRLNGGSPSESEAVVAGAEAAIVTMPEGASDQMGSRLESANGRCRERVDGGGPEGVPSSQEVLSQGVEVG
jgi:hypothetical protein